MSTFRFVYRLLFVVLVVATLSAPGIVQAAPHNWSLNAVDNNAKKVADWMNSHPIANRPAQLDWTYGAYYAGITALGLSDPSQNYLKQVREHGQKSAWGILNRTYHADDHCIGQSWLELAAFDNNLTYIEPIKLTYDYILANPHKGTMDFTKPNNQKRWSWCDALYMSPTVLVRLYGLTGDTRYLDFMDQEYKATTDLLYDKEYHLYFRDSRYLKQKTKNGFPRLWSRGNGWVFASLPIILRDLPQDRPSRAFYTKIFTEMAEALKLAQRQDGAWGPSLADKEDPSMQEMSGTAFFTYGFLWGINNGLLDKETYLPVVQGSWKALCRNINDVGRLGWVQQIGDRPVDSYTADNFEVYAAGAFLAAAMELRKLILTNNHPQHKVVTVTNPLERYRSGETITLELDGLGLDPDKIFVFDLRNSSVMYHQLFDSDGDGTPDQLLFSTYLTAKQTREFLVFESTSILAPLENNICFSRYAPDRMDDFLWENDRTAARIYGPALMKPAPAGESLVSSGVDIWNKKVRHPVINQWLLKKRYHIDQGEGMDSYKVGTSRGCGGLGVFNQGHCFVSENWATQKHLANGPVRTAFEVTYAPWKCGDGTQIQETRRITLDAGSHLARFESRLTVTGEAKLEGGPGLDISAARNHNGNLALHPENGWLANYEPEQPEEGNIATALVVPYKAKVTSDDQENIYLTTTIGDEPLIWYAGAGWSGAGDFVKADYWNTYVETFALSLRHPLKITIK